MFLGKDTITVSKAAIKKYGVSGAVFLQVLYAEYEWEIPLDVELWKPLFEGVICVSKVQSTITALRNKGKLEIIDDMIYLNEKPYSQQTVYDIIGEPDSPEIEEKEKKANPTWDMAVVLCKVMGFNEKFYNPRRYLKPAGRILKEGFDKDYIDKRYSPGGWWYIDENTYKGQKGSPPNLNDIFKTIESKGKAQETSPSSEKSMWS